uniref:Uncharacterized protein n=1 Tax=Pan troglodytes TaxID=9598 RepID=H2RFW8_PANTR
SCGVGRAAQALVRASAEESTAFRMEAVQEGAAGVESEQAALGEEAVLLLDDIMAEVEVVAEEEGLVERQEEAQRAQPGPGPMTPESALEELLAVQVELEPVNAQARKAFSRQREKMERRRKPNLDRRGAVIQSVPVFCANVIANHPKMSALITDENEDMLIYVVSLEVEEEKHPVHLCKIMLFFWKYRASHSTPAYRRRHHNSSLNFFNWISDHNFAGSSKIAEVNLCKDLWRNPLQYYKRMKPPEEGTETSGDSQLLS